MVEQRGPYTVSHAEGISRLAVAIGNQMGMERSKIGSLLIIFLET